MNGQTGAPPAEQRPVDPATLPGAPPDALGDVTVALTPRQLAFLALIAAVILAILRRVLGRVRSGRTGADAG
jgi:hypothetical protein